MFARVIIASSVVCSTVFGATMHYSFDNKSFDKSISNITDTNDVNLDVSGLSDGFHTVYFRTTDSDGVNSNIVQKSFYLKVNNFDSKVQYSINNKSFDTKIDYSQDFNIDVSGLNDGLHTIYMKTSDEDNITSNIVQKSFYLKENNFDSKVHYSINNKSFEKSVAYSDDFDIDVSYLDNGLHTIYLRTSNEDNITSNIVRKTIFVNDNIGYIPPIVATNYSIDVTNADEPISSGDNIDVSNIDMGSHTLYIQAINELGIMSPKYEVSFAIEDLSNLIQKVLSSGWSLTALPTTTNIDNINIPSLSIIWKYDSGKWYAYSPNSDLKSAISNSGIDTFTSIDNNKGYWVKTTSTSTVSFANGDNQNNISYATMPSGWHLVSNSGVNNMDTHFENSGLNTAWTYKDGKWYAYSPDSDMQNAILRNSEINTLQTISSQDGFWIHK
jgi:phosphopantetheine adenylyltransferase